MKKKKVFKYLSLILSIILIFGILNISATEEYTVEQVTSIKNQLVNRSNVNSIYEYKISSSNLNRLKTILKNEGNTQSEQNRAVLKELGYTEDELDSIGQDEIDMLVNSSEEITVTEQYVHFDKDEDISIISKEQYLQNVALKQKNDKIRMSAIKSSSNNSNNGNNSETVNDMKITTTAFYIKPKNEDELGWYWISGTYSWLSAPIYRITDAMSLLANDARWSQNMEDYASTLSYVVDAYPTYARTIDLPVTQTSHRISKTTQDLKIETGGMFYTWDLPDNSVDYDEWLGYIVNDMTFYIRGKIRVSDHTNPRAFNVFSRYEHVSSGVSINPSFGWDISGGVVLESKNDHSTYRSLCQVEYYPDRDTKF